MRLDSPSIGNSESTKTSAAAKAALRQKKTPVPEALKHLFRQMCSGYSKCVAFDFWGAEYLVLQSQKPALTLHFNHPGVVRNLVLFRDRFFLTECWLNKYFEFDGSVDDLILFVEHLSSFRPTFDVATGAAAAALKLPQLKLQANTDGDTSALDYGSGSNARQIQHHYDVGNDFYQLVLDPLMVYSCAYFRHDDMNLAEAQKAKLDLICRKLRLKPGERLLDVGCGWGGLLRHAAREYGVVSRGITLSKEQLEFARRKAAEEGLSDRVQIDLLDYRQLPEGERFDKIVSVGMIEHVGVRNYPVYFGKLLDALKPGGLFLCHGITTYGASNRPTFNGKFVRKYIFPGGELANLQEVVHYASVAGWEPVDVDGWRPHYVKTLRAWAANLLSNWDKATEIAGERVAKLWLLYLSASARGFENNYLRIYQVLLRRHDDLIWDLPLTRTDWLA